MSNRLKWDTPGIKWDSENTFWDGLYLSVILSEELVPDNIASGISVKVSGLSEITEEPGKDFAVFSSNSIVSANSLIVEINNDSASFEIRNTVVGTLLSNEPTGKDSSQIDVDVIPSITFSLDEADAKDSFLSNSNSIVSANFSRSEPEGEDIASISTNSKVSTNIVLSEKDEKDVFVSDGNILVGGNSVLLESPISDTSTVFVSTKIHANFILLETNTKDILSSFASNIIDVNSISIIESSNDDTNIIGKIAVVGNLQSVETTFDGFASTGFVEQVGVPFALYVDEITTTSARINWTFEVSENQDTTFEIEVYSKSGFQQETGEVLLQEDGSKLIFETQTLELTRWGEAESSTEFTVVGSTEYGWRIRQIQGEFFGDWSSWQSFWTAQEATLLVSEEYQDTSEIFISNKIDSLMNSTEEFVDEISFFCNTIISGELNPIDLAGRDSFGGSCNSIISSNFALTEIGKDQFGATAFSKISVSFEAIEEFLEEEFFGSSGNLSISGQITFSETEGKDSHLFNFGVIVSAEAFLSESGTDSGQGDATVYIQGQFNQPEPTTQDTINSYIKTVLYFGFDLYESGTDSTNYDIDVIVSANSDLQETAGNDSLEIETHIIISYASMGISESTQPDIAVFAFKDFWTFGELCFISDISITPLNALSVLVDIAPLYKLNDLAVTEIINSSIELCPMDKR